MLAEWKLPWWKLWWFTFLIAIYHSGLRICVDKRTIPCSLFEMQMTSLYFVTRIVQVDIICFPFCVDQADLASLLLFWWFCFSWGHEKNSSLGVLISVIITYYLNLLEPLNCLLFMCFVLIPWKNLGICNYISKTGLLWCLWTFVEKKMEDWRRITSSCLESLTQWPWRAFPATKTW